MALNFITNRLKALLLIFLGAFRRALCCFRRRRRSSSCSPIPLTAVGVVPDSINNSVGREDGPELHSWNSWEDGSSPDSVITDVGHNMPAPANSIQQHIELYRQSQMRQPFETEMGEPAEDYFQDMTPRITKQQKVLVSTSKREDGEGEESPGGSGIWSPRLAVSSVSIPYLNSSELESWDEREMDGGGWDETAGAEAWEQARALTQAKRAAEQQRRRREREGKTRLGARVGGTS
ncbi:hypothetical protein J437_LFUL012546 [Ladona fulva]|uniref:Receptor-binding cancer antigen expressed on SiSo cells n=1 Tax=Ladona fulva TaxID=123851 RepID=A0A8K0P282_LADFU|nr:hypothetical protein J437_LFUL012546 [Ladona fulva]